MIAGADAFTLPGLDDRCNEARHRLPLTFRPSVCSAGRGGGDCRHPARPCACRVVTPGAAWVRRIAIRVATV